MNTGFAEYAETVSDSLKVSGFLGGYRPHFSKYTTPTSYPYHIWIVFNGSLLHKNVILHIISVFLFSSHLETSTLTVRHKKKNCRTTERHTNNIPTTYRTSTLDTCTCATIWLLHSIDFRLTSNLPATKNIPSYTHY